MAISLLLGNGINRLNGAGISWEAVLRQISASDPTGRTLELVSQKPFALVYEEILLSNLAVSKVLKEFEIKKQIATLVEGLVPNQVHKAAMSAGFRHVITTNYDYCLERAIGGSFLQRNMQSESKYSMFRRRAAGRKFVWHIHGEASAPNTITLGYDQYSGYLQKLRTYATAERTGEHGSPFKRNQLDFDEVDKCLYSWLDIFFRDDVHIVGLGLDFTELDLWWALTYKRRLAARGFPTGRTFFHDWHSGRVDDAALAKRSLLTGLGAEVSVVDCHEGFEAAYTRFLADTPIS